MAILAAWFHGISWDAAMIKCWYLFLSLQLYFKVHNAATAVRNPHSMKAYSEHHPSNMTLPPDIILYSLLVS